MLSGQRRIWLGTGFICKFLYIHPEISTLLKTGQYLSLDTLQSECANYERWGWVLLCGDVNARINSISNFIEN